MKWKVTTTAAIVLAICFSNYAYAKYEPLRQTPFVKQVDSIVHTIDYALQHKKNSSNQIAANHEVQKTKVSNPVSTLTQNSSQAQNSRTTNTSNTQSTDASNLSILVHVPAQSQNPELYNGCEMTSLSMLLEFAGHPVDKMTLANEIAKDPTPETLNDDGSIASWGDPNQGFVGDITGNSEGYGVYHGPVYQLLNQIVPGQAIDMTGDSFQQILNQVAAGKPVVAWTTVNFVPTASWITWQGPNGPVHATFNEHVVLVVGYTNTSILINDPLDGTAAKAVDRAQFEAAWQQLGQQAVSVQ